MSKIKSSTSSVHAAAIITGAFLSGAMMMLSLITVPIFLATVSDPALLVRLWACMYDYGHISAPPMAITTLAMYLYTARTYKARGQGWANPIVAGITTICIVPFTLIFMVPTNDELFRLTVESEAGAAIWLDEVRRLIIKWAWLHLMRSFFPLAGVMVGISGTS